MRRDILVSGWYGHANSGDEAILTVLLTELGRRFDLRASVLTHGHERVSRDYASLGAAGLRHWEYLGLRGAENLLRGRLGPQFAAMRRADAFVLGGGGLLRDNTNWLNLGRLLDDVFLARLLGVPVAFYAVGVGPLRSALGRRAIGAAARAASLITVRDEHSAALLRGLGLGADRVTVVSDPALLLPDADPARAAARAGLTDFLAAHPRTLFVYPASALAHPPLAPGDDRHLVRLAAAVGRLCAEDGYAAVFVPLRVAPDDPADDDDATIQRLIRHLPPGTPHRAVRAALAPVEVRALTRLATVNLTVRLHAMIYAVSCGVPCVALDYEPKVRANAARFGLAEYVVDLSDDAGADARPGAGPWDERAVRAVRRLAGGMDAERARLAAALPGLRDGARRTFTLLERLLRQPRRDPAPGARSPDPV